MKREGEREVKARSGGSARSRSRGSAKALPDREVAAASGDGSGPAFELRYSGTEKRLDAVFRGLKGGPVRRSRLRVTYYDTADARLFDRGYVLSLRPQGKAQELRLESLDGAASGTWCATVAEPIAEIGRLPKSAPRGEIGVILPEELKPRVSSSQQIETRTLTLEGATATATLIGGRLKAGGREEALAELRFSLVAGDRAVLIRALKSALRGGGLTFIGRSSAARGMDLFAGRPPPWVKASRPALAGGDSLGQAMAKILSVTARQITGNIAASADGRDPEGVHQLRVALRRLRSAFTLFKGHLSPAGIALAEGSKAALSALGPARDLDVFLTETLPPLLTGDTEDPGLQRLAKRAVARQGKAYTAVRRLLSSARFNGFLLDLQLAAEQGITVISDPDSPLRPVAAAHLQKRHKQVMKVGRDFAAMQNVERHEVRIALKKLRYACDYFQALFPGKASIAYLQDMASLQDDLGRLNDATVAEHLVDDLADGDAAAAHGGALVKGWYRHRLQSVEPHMLGAWAAFAHDRPFWRK